MTAMCDVRNERIDARRPNKAPLTRAASILALLLAAAPASLAQPTPSANKVAEPPSATWQSFGETCQRAREVYLTFRDAEGATLTFRDAEGARRAQLAQVAVTELAQLAKRDDVGTGVLSYLHLKARLLAEKDRVAVARDAIALCSSDPRVAPEAIDLIWTVAWDAGDKPSRWMIEEALGCALPISTYGRGRDLRAETSFGHSERPVMPRISESKFPRVAEIYAAAHLPRSASEAYVEAIYATASPIGSGGWVSPKTGALWVKAAQAAAAAGDQKALALYAAKAIIFGSDDDAAAGRKLLEDASTGKLSVITTAPAAVDRDALLTIGRLYVEMNLHPRALALLREHAALLGVEGQALTRQWTTEWTELVEKYCDPQMVQNCTLFGQDVAKTDVANMRIPWPCEPAEVEKAVAKLREIPLLKP
jgi:hypothetical protein